MELELPRIEWRHDRQLHGATGAAGAGHGSLRQCERRSDAHDAKERPVRRRYFQRRQRPWSLDLELLRHQWWRRGWLRSASGHIRWRTIAFDDGAIFDRFRSPITTRGACGAGQFRPRHTALAGRTIAAIGKRLDAAIAADETIPAAAARRQCAGILSHGCQLGFGRANGA